MPRPTPDEISDFIDQCRSDTIATSDATAYLEMIEWLIFGKERPDLKWTNYYEVECEDCGSVNRGYTADEPYCVTCGSTRTDMEKFERNPYFIEDD